MDTPVGVAWWNVVVAPRPVKPCNCTLRGVEHGKRSYDHSPIAEDCGDLLYRTGSSAFGQISVRRYLAALVWGFHARLSLP
jgi:hypothetical protein